MARPIGRVTPRVRLSRAARRFAADNGGVLYLWVERSGRRHGWLSVAMTRPADVAFGPVTDVDGVWVYVQQGMRALLGRPVTVRLWRIPRPHLDANGAVLVDPPAGS